MHAFDSCACSIPVRQHVQLRFLRWTRPVRCSSHAVSQQEHSVGGGACDCGHVRVCAGGADRVRMQEGQACVRVLCDARQAAAVEGPPA